MDPLPDNSMLTANKSVWFSWRIRVILDMDTKKDRANMCMVNALEDINTLVYFYIVLTKLTWLSEN